MATTANEYVPLWSPAANGARRRFFMIEADGSSGKKDMSGIAAAYRTKSFAKFAATHPPDALVDHRGRFLPDAR